jgi:DNA gyrase subunit B
MKSRNSVRISNFSTSYVYKTFLWMKTEAKLQVRMRKMAKDKDNYGAGSLTVLEGLDAVRKRPGMYIGTTDSQGLMHCLWEIIDNSVDEALAGVCNHIVVTLHSDGSVEVADNGRGIPVDIEPKTKLTGVEVVLTKLHAGAKFGNSSYGASGGLHGVGSSVVNALSSRLDVEVDRDGKTHHMSFHQGHPGVYTDADPEHPSPDAPFKRTRKNRPTELEIIGKVSPKTTGTRIRYWADPEIFNDTAEFSYEQLIDRVRQTSFLVPGLKITVIDENIPETGDESVDEMLEVDDIANAAGDEPQEIAESDESEHDAAGHEEAAEQIEEADVAAQPQGSKYTHSRIEEFCHTGGVKDFVDYLSKGEAVSAIWRITGEDTYVEETQAVGDGGELRKLEEHEHKDGRPERLVLIEAVTDGEGGVDHELGGRNGKDEIAEKLKDDQQRVTAQRGLHFEERCENIIEKIGDILESAPAGDSNHQREKSHDERRSIPHGGNDELGDEQLMEAHRQRQREIALVLEHMVAPADGGEHQRHKRQRTKAHHKADDQQYADEL